MLKIYLLAIAMLSVPFLISAQETQSLLKWKEVHQQPTEWYGSDEAIRIADNLLVFQHSTGGWPKNIDMARVLKEDDIIHIINDKTNPKSGMGQPTIDNQATYPQIRYLLNVFEKTEDQRYFHSIQKGIEYLIAAQYENGGWPQFYPLRNGYYSHITYNDGAMMGVMFLLRDIAQGKYPFLADSVFTKARTAVTKGIDIILKTQIPVDGELTVWCAQHDRETFEPAKARSYELPTLSGSESVGIVKFLMEIDHPDDEIIHAVQSAIKWFQKSKISGVKIAWKKDNSTAEGYDKIIEFDPVNAPPLWGRFYEISTNRPVFVDRDGIIKYALSEIGKERRTGYKWLGNWAENLLSKQYPEWCAKWNIESVFED